MKRRNFALMSASSAVAISAGMALPKLAKAASADKAALLKTTLTPMGSERAGNADGSIPAWTGGVTTVIAGWTPDENIYPDIYADEKPLLVIDAANMAQYADGLSDGVKYMMSNLGYSINVYQTHRTASAPQSVYDNIANNLVSTQVNPKGARFGFSNAYGGIPFPIPDEDDNKGAEMIWNHLCRWQGYNYNRKISAFSVVGGQVVLGATGSFDLSYPYYAPGGNATTFNNLAQEIHSALTAPAPLYGQQLIEYDYIDPLQQPTQIWQLLQGQGRVRKAPELAFDTPVPGGNGLQLYDEINGFRGSPVRFNWTCVGKQEMYVPYNCNGMFAAEPDDLLLPHFLNPKYVRWEKHRVWVVDAVLAPGERDVIPHRRMYLDEDTWTIAMVDEFDGSGSLTKFIELFNEFRPDFPGTIFAATFTLDIQKLAYTYGGAPFNDSAYGGQLTENNLPPSYYNPENMAAQAQY